ncbi:CpaE family protein [Leisingera daeponensis]|uniref:AAA family ATPase n=1 Tax=Leisingera daeponensis TaxID=405746 RepID=UPI001C947B7B|nr:AAA family ATPase [Leisingera daeponensis]MBY6057148.1 AAA family ATPase [Leisingera daeponensis]
MQAETQTIVVISKDPAVSALVASVAQFQPGTGVRKCASALGEINGTALQLAEENDLIIFRADGEPGRDAAAVREILRHTGGAARILALADASMPLADLRLLTEAGVREVLPDSASADELSAAIRACLKHEEPQPAAGARSSREGMVVAVSQSCGGAGATTLAVNLADCLTRRRGLRRQEAEFRVALLDLDIQFGTVASFLDLPPNRCLYELASEGFVPDSVFAEQSLSEAAPGLWVLASPAEIAPLHALKPEQVQALIAHLRLQFDFVVIGLPRALAEWLTPVLEASERLLMVTGSSVPAICQARRLLDFYAETSMSLQAEIVISRERKPLLAASHHKEAARLLQKPFKYWLPNDPSAAAAAADRGVPLSVAAGRSALAKAVRRLSQDLIETRNARAHAAQSQHGKAV